MAEIQDRLRSAQQRLSSASAQRTRAEVEEENAQKALDQTKEALREEFGIVTSADLAKVRQELDDALTTALAEAEAQLDAAQA